MVGLVKVNEFKLSILTALEKINLDPVFDYSQADEEARKIIAQAFNNDNQGKELSVIFSNIKQSARLIYEKSGVFNHGIQDGELSTSKVGTNAIDFCKALIHLVREQLEDLETLEIFIPIALKWHIGVAVFILNEKNDGDSIIISEPSDSQWDDLLTKHLDKEWKEWGAAEYSNKDDFEDEYDWADAEVFLRDTWQAEEINKITKELRI